MTLAEAIADTLRRSHVRLATAVPGHGATQAYEAWQRKGESTPPFSFHEEVAVGMAHGAALLGHRSVVLLKAHGFLKAANAIADSLEAAPSISRMLSECAPVGSWKTTNRNPAVVPAARLSAMALAALRKPCALRSTAER